MRMFARPRLKLKSAVSRNSLVHLDDAKEGIGGVPELKPYRVLGAINDVVGWIKNRPGPNVWFLGGHVFKANVGWYLERLIPFMDHMATNGAGLVHSWEMRKLGHTSENVAEAIKDGSFGMWKETAEINDELKANWHLGIGGTFFPLWKSSTVHISIGQDVFCMHPNYDPRKWGEIGYTDFLKFVSVVEGMEGGTFLVFGSAVCAPEVFLKALAMARNVNNGYPKDIAVAVFDCVDIWKMSPEDRYYNRPHKNLMCRIATESMYVHGRHEDTIPNLWKLLCAQ